MTFHHQTHEHTHTKKVSRDTHIKNNKKINMNMNARNVFFTNIFIFSLVWMLTSIFTLRTQTPMYTFWSLLTACSKGSLLWKHFKRHLRKIYKKGEQKLWKDNEFFFIKELSFSKLQPSFLLSLSWSFPVEIALALVTIDFTITL